MKVVLAKDFTSLGFAGDTVEVKRGYARNFLVPRGIAVEASSRNARELSHQMERIQAIKKKLKAEAEELASQLKQADIKLELKIGRGGKSFGSVASKDIEAVLSKLGFSLSKKQILLQDPIRMVGEYPVAVKLHSELTSEILVKVVADPESEKLLAAAKKKEEAAIAEADAAAANDSESDSVEDDDTDDFDGDDAELADTLEVSE